MIFLENKVSAIFCAYKPHPFEQWVYQKTFLIYTSERRYEYNEVVFRKSYYWNTNVVYNRRTQLVLNPMVGIQNFANNFLSETVDATM